MYNHGVVTVHGSLMNIKRDLYGLWNELVAELEAMTQDVCNEGDARACESEAIGARDNARTKLTQLRNCLLTSVSG